MEISDTRQFFVPFEVYVLLPCWVLHVYTVMSGSGQHTLPRFSA